MRVIELFAGIGAPRMVLDKLGIEYEDVGISEIDSNALKAYNLIHGETNNFGDISKIEELPECDFLHASSPCVSFSQSGKKNGLDGASGLIREFYRLLENYKERNCLPKYISFENVIDLKIRPKFYPAYKELIDNLKSYGYNIYESTLAAHYFGNPTIRERLFIICIRKDIDDETFTMPQNYKIMDARLIDFLDEEIDKKYLWPHTGPFHPLKDEENRIDTTRILGWLETACGHQTQSNRVWSRMGFCPTLTCNSQFVVNSPQGYRKITEKEMWRIMGFSDEDYKKIEGKISKSGIIKVVGNSIALGPLEAIYKNLFNGEKLC